MLPLLSVHGHDFTFMRITAGSMRGRTMTAPEIDGLRPTASRVREALFNIVGDLHGDSVLDLFAGSGVIGLEAMSRGASSVCSIEADRNACQTMSAIRDAWKLEGWAIQTGKLPQALPAAQHFDFIFADAPYDKGLSAQIPAWLQKAGITYHTLVIEETSRLNVKWKNDMMPIKHRKYGESTLYFFEPVVEPAVEQVVEQA